MLTELTLHSVSSSLSEDVNHHKLICWQWLRSLLITLSLKIDRLVCQRWVFTVVHSCEFEHSDVDDLYTLCQHSHKVQWKVWHCEECLDVSCELHIPLITQEELSCSEIDTKEVTLTSQQTASLRKYNNML